MLSEILNVYEHQSSYNPNMPLRFLEYVSELFSGYISENKLNKYGSERLELPTPKLVVFYNGTKEQEDESILKLSDSFNKNLGIEADVEVKVRMINVNAGRNQKIMQACKPLEEYAWLVERIRENLNQFPNAKKAFDEAIRAMPEDYEIRGFLIKHRAEVRGMLDTEYNEEEIRKLFMEDGRREERANTEREKARADAAETRADVEKNRADAERNRADAERNRADAAESRADALEEENRMLKEQLKKINKGSRGLSESSEI